MVFNMKAIIAQKLLPSITPGVGRVPACEVMLFTPTVRKLLLEEQDDKLSDAIRIGREEGMQDFTWSLRDLVERNMIDKATALEVAQRRGAEDGVEGHQAERVGHAVSRNGARTAPPRVRKPFNGEPKARRD